MRLKFPEMTVWPGYVAVGHRPESKLDNNEREIREKVQSIDQSNNIRTPAILGRVKIRQKRPAWVQSWVNDAKAGTDQFGNPLSGAPGTSSAAEPRAGSSTYHHRPDTTPVPPGGVSTTDQGTTFLPEGSSSRRAKQAVPDHDSSDVNSVDARGKTRLHLAAARGDSIQTHRLLGSAGIDVNKPDNQGSVALHDAVMADSVSVIKVLLDNEQVDGNVQNDESFSPLLLAVSRNKKNSVVALSQSHKVDFSQRDGNGNSILHLAAMNGHDALLENLINSGKVSVNAVNNENRTTLHAAAANNNAHATRALLANKDIDLGLRDRSGSTAYDLAFEAARSGGGRAAAGIFESLVPYEAITTQVQFKRLTEDAVTALRQLGLAIDGQPDEDTLRNLKPAELRKKFHSLSIKTHPDKAGAHASGSSRVHIPQNEISAAHDALKAYLELRDILNSGKRAEKASQR